MVEVGKDGAAGIRAFGRTVTQRGTLARPDREASERRRENIPSGPGKTEIPVTDSELGLGGHGDELEFVAQIVV